MKLYIENREINKPSAKNVCYAMFLFHHLIKASPTINFGIQFPLGEITQRSSILVTAVHGVVGI